jgi:hypothetical protein
MMVNQLRHLKQPLSNSVETLTQRVVLYDVSWQTYQASYCLIAMGDHRSSRACSTIVQVRCVLEITMPSDPHQ